MSVHFADSITLVVASSASDTSSNFTKLFNPPIILDGNSHYEIALVRSLLWYSWFNISSAQSNNTVKLSDDSGSTWTTCTFADGTYSISDMQTQIENVLVTDMSASATGVVLEPQHATGKVRVELESGYQIDFDSSITAILGFASGVVTSSSTAPNQANITNSVDSLLIHCSLVDHSTSYVNGTRSEVLYSVAPPTVSPGSLFNAVDTPNLIYLEMNRTTISDIHFRITSQDGSTPVEFGSGTGDIITHYLHIRKVRI